ncbi:MAG: RDD family protein [Chitinophagaceae bacterium]
MNTIKITTSQNIELEYDLSSVGERIIAYLIDALIIGAYIILMFIFIYSGSVYRMSETLVYLAYLPVLFYHLLCEVLMNGQTVGKKSMKIRVISLDGASASLGQYLIRWVFRLVDFTITSGLAALVSVAVSAKRQRIGDIVAGTTLIKTIPRTTLHETLYVPRVAVDHHVQFPEVETLSDSDMQLVKEVIINVRKSGNSLLALQAAEKIEATIGVTRGHLEPMQFLLTLLADYNALTSKV